MSELYNVSSVKIKGGIFEKETELPIFANAKNKPRFCLLYGKNGTGKSTISRAFNEINDNKKTGNYEIELLDKDGSNISLSDEDKQSVYVFNEDFIEQNIRIEQDGLNAIVVMGAKKDIDDKIKELRPQYEKSEKDFENQNKKCADYLDSKNVSSPLYYEKEMINLLKGDENWAGRDAYIKGNVKRNSSVGVETYKQFINLSTVKTRDELIVEYAKLKIDFENAKNGGKSITIPVKTKYDFNDIEAQARQLLAEKIEKPVLTEREKYLISLLKKEDGLCYLQGIKSYFSVEEHNQCPYCLQNVSEEYAHGMVESIEKILNKKVENHQNSIGKIVPLTYEIDLSQYKELDENVIKNCKEKLQIVNEAAEQIKEALIEKSANVYVPIELPNIKLKDKYDELILALEELENKRTEYNAKVTNLQPFVEKLNEINSLIAKYDIENSYISYQKQKEEKQKEDEALNTMQSKMQSLKKQLDDLEEEKKNVRIAMEAINDDLKYIFFSKERLKIDYKEDKYVLFSHGKPVEPNNVSVGERNAIGLCYFFNRIMENRDELTVYNNSYMLIIDDPVSSFDMENRVGILSYLKYELNRFALGCKESRFLIMTHDLQTLFDSSKYVEEILERCAITFNGQAGQNKKCVNILELSDLKVTPSNLLGRHEYTALLEMMYDYALDGNAEYSMIIGNVMRKVLEAFGTFTYKKGIDELSTNSDILDGLPEIYKKYFENLMYRLVLNGGSHLKDKTQTIDDMNFYDYISDEEKQRTARDILCFLYKLNPKHIAAHLKEKSDVEMKITEWCQENIEK